jgi:tetratricopeptide (TPR) repeat protein
MSVAELEQVLCSEQRSFSEKLAHLRQEAAHLSEQEVERLAQALKSYSDGLRNALKPDPHSGVLTFLLGKHARHGRAVAFGYAHLIHGVRYNINGSFSQAYRHLRRAMRYFEQAQNEYGWARAVISYVWAAFHLNKKDALDAYFARAKRIFTERRDYESLSILYGNTLAVHLHLDRKDEKFIAEYLALSELPQLSVVRRARIFDNAGYWHTQHGREYEAVAYHRKACELLSTVPDQLQPYLVGHLNLVESLRRIGRIQEALRYLQAVRPRLPDASVSGARKAHAQFAHNEAACLRVLNRPAEALRTLQQFMQRFPPTAERDHDYIYIQRELGAAYAELGDYDRALEAFQCALDALNAEDEINRNRLLLLRLAVQLRRYTDQAESSPERLLALQAEADALRAKLQADALHSAEAQLLVAQAQALGDPCAALSHAEEAVRAAQALDILPLQYDAQLTLGKAQAAAGDVESAVQSLQAAVACVETMQRDLVMLFRARFLSNKGDALHQLIAIHIQQGDYSRAFDTIERAKASAFLSLIIGEDSLQVSPEAHIAPVLEEIGQLRAQLYLAEMDKPLPSAEMLAKRERLKALTEQLYSALQVQHERDPRQVLPWQELQTYLPEDGLLIAFYEDGAHFGVFWFDAKSASPSYARLACDTQTVNDLIERAKFETDAVNFILANYASDATPEASLAFAAADPDLARRHRRFARHMEEAFQAFLAPLAKQLARYRQLFIVPYGGLHNVPLHLLRAPADDHETAYYLIERHVVTILPTANLIARRPTKLPNSVLVVWDDRRWNAQRSFQHAERTAQLICANMPESYMMHVESIAPEDIFKQDVDAVHLIAHAEYDPQYPTEACIWLGRQALEMSQILQQRLNYALVFLNSCSIGQLHMERAHGKRAFGDDLIGLGRAFLYAGAGALITSLWNVFDGFTLPLIEPFYSALRKGDSSAAALQKAQQAFRQQFRTAQHDLHPVIWGAFQAIGM